MQSQVQGASWDFSPVYNLLSSLSSEGPDNSQPLAPADGSYRARKLAGKSDRQSGSATLGADKCDNVSLGDFSQLWKYLGVLDTPVPTTTPFEASLALKEDNNTYASDGYIDYPPNSRSVRWRDQVMNGGDLAETQPDSPTSQDNTKKKKKKGRKQRRKEKHKKAKEDAKTHEMFHNLQRKKAVKDAESSDETSGTARDLASNSASPKKKPAQKLKSKAASKKSVQGQISMSEAVPATEQTKRVDVPHEDAKYQSDGAQRPTQVTALPEKPTTNSEIESKAHRPERSKAVESSPEPSTPIRSLDQYKQEPLSGKWPVANPATEIYRAVNSSAPRPNLNQIIQHQSENPLSRSSTVAAALTTPTRTSPRHVLQPLDVNLSSVDRNWSLLLKLMNKFPEDRSHLLAPLQLTSNAATANGIHVFVDASNILIGFHEQLKRARGIPEGARVPRVYPSFYALALLLERRRPVSKRILVGSTPDVTPFDEARRVGYETNIFEKVYKIREMTERQKRFALREQGRANGNSSGHASESATGGSGSGGNSLLPSAHARWVEQGVDETLHLKIMESILDGKAPAAENAQGRPTMIVATGDAAEAEYSSGFLAMIKRALAHGWNVEVAAWGANTSQEYWNLERQGQWQGRFRVVKLDDFAEELFPVED